MRHAHRPTTRHIGLLSIVDNAVTRIARDTWRDIVKEAHWSHAVSSLLHYLLALACAVQLLPALQDNGAITDPRLALVIRCVFVALAFLHLAGAAVTIGALLTQQIEQEA